MEQALLEPADEIACGGADKLTAKGKRERPAPLGRLADSKPQRAVGPDAEPHLDRPALGHEKRSIHVEALGRRGLAVVEFARRDEGASSAGQRATTCPERGTDGLEETSLESRPI